jgi:hypothetical protein
MELTPTVVSGRWFHSRAVLWKACLVLQNLKQSATSPVLHWKKKKIQCGCTCVYDLLIALSKFLTERHVHTSIRQQSESMGLSCQNLNLFTDIPNNTEVNNILSVGYQT